MASYTGTTAAGHTLQLDVSLNGQSIEGNYSSVHWSLTWYKNPSRTPFGSDGSWSANIDGSGYGGGYSYNFNNYSALTVGAGDQIIYHNADGTRAFGVSASGYIGSAGGSASLSGTYTLPTIARASTPSLSSQPTTGSPVTIATNRASAGFTHTLTWAFGSQTGTIGTNVTDSVSWTPDRAMLTEIPNSLSGTGTITCTTFSGGTNVGTKSIGFTLTADASIVPTIASISCAEAQAAVTAAGIGGYVQGLSQLALQINGAAGVYGSSITSSAISVAGQIINAASGTTAPIVSSGNVAITAIVVDSRGRSAQATMNVTVLPYSAPTIDTTALTLQRALADGTLNDNGTYLKVSFKIAATSLNPTGAAEKNTLKYRVSSRQNGQTVFTQIIAPTAPGGIAYTGSVLIAGYSIDHSWDVLLDVIDDFATSSVQRTVATSTIFMHWHGSQGVGVGKYHERGILDVSGDIYQGGLPVVDFGDSATTSSPGIVQLATPADFAAGNSSKAVTPAQLSAMGSAFSKITNGAFTVNKRKYAPQTAAEPGTYFFDRWKFSGRKNLITNPASIVGTEIMAASNGSVSRLTGLTIPGLPYTTTAARITMTANAGGWYFASDANNPRTQVTPGKTYYVSAYVRSSQAITVTLAVQQFTASGAGPGSCVVRNQDGTTKQFTLAPNVWTRIGGVVVAHVQALYAGPYAYSTTAFAAGATYDVTGIMLEEGDVMMPYFDGSYPDCSWADGEGQSASYSVPNGWTCLNYAGQPSAESGNTTGFASNMATLSVSTDWSADRTRSYKVVASGAGADSFMSYAENNGLSAWNLVPGQTYTISATGHIGPSPLSGATIDTASVIRARRAYVTFLNSSGQFVAAAVPAGSPGIATPEGSVASDAVPNVAGATARVSVTFTVPLTATNFYFRLYNGHAAGTIYWDATQMTKGTSVQPYFDGATAAAGIYKYGWNGTPDNGNSSRIVNRYADFTATPQGQAITLSAQTRICQIIEREELSAGTHILAHDGTAQMRVYNVQTNPQDRPAFVSGPLTVTLDGTDDVIVEFTAPAAALATVANVRLYRGSADFGYAPRSVADELVRCQRFYLRFDNQFTGDRLSPDGQQDDVNWGNAVYQLPTPMRRVPGVLTAGGPAWSDSVNFTTAVAYSGPYQSRNLGAFGPVTPPLPSTRQLTSLKATFLMNAGSGASSRPGYVSSLALGSAVMLDAEMVG
ncbi:DUF859 family phage minor structural protein [Pseudolysinimonas sp.]|uniref:DUF859 family phage minor structural protein n=1 Tax=Pseudolysinimonas sp. TaxID=2680009 RepID=UPI003F806C52